MSGVLVDFFCSTGLLVDEEEVATVTLDVAGTVGVLDDDAFVFEVVVVVVGIGVAVDAGIVAELVVVALKLLLLSLDLVLLLLILLLLLFRLDDMEGCVTLFAIVSVLVLLLFGVKVVV